MSEEEYLALQEEIRHLREEQHRLVEKLEAAQAVPRDKAPGAGNGAKPEHKPPSPPVAEDQPAQPAGAADEGEGHEHDQHPDESKSRPSALRRLRRYAAAHPSFYFLAVVLLVVVVLCVVLLWRYFDSYESTDDAQVGAHLVIVTSRVSGSVKEVYVENNQAVKAGQLLVDLDPRDFRVALDRAQALYSQAKAALEATHPQVPIQLTTNQSQLSTVQAGVASAQAALAAAVEFRAARLADLQKAVADNDKAQSDLVRFRPLARKNEISQQQLDAVVDQAKSSAQLVDAAKAAADAATQNVDEAKAQLAEARYRQLQVTRNAPQLLAASRATVLQRVDAVTAAEAQLDQARLDFSYSRIFAPVAGIIDERAVEIGQSISPGEQLMVISQIGDVWITANFKETQLRRMHPGERATIHVDTFDKDFRGYVESMPGATGAETSLLPPENATGNFVKVVQRLPVRILLDPGEDPQHTLRPGMSVEPKVWLK